MSLYDIHGNDLKIGGSLSLVGKHGLFIGDSLTTTLTGLNPETNGYVHATKSYPEYFAEKTGCIAHIYGTSGASASSYLEYSYPKIDFSIDYDFAVVMLGTNMGMEGIWGEKYANLVEQLTIDTGGKTQIFLVTPPYNNYATGSSAQWAKNSNQPVKDVGKTYCLPVIDAYYDSGINQSNGTLYRPIDDLHFNDAGYERLAGFIASQVLSKYWL